MKKLRYQGMVCLVLLCLITINLQVNAHGNSKMKFKNPVIEEDFGGAVDVVCTDSAEGMSVSYQFTDKGYHSATVFMESYYELEGERGVLVSVQNKAAFPVRLNIAVVDGDGIAFQIKDGCYVQLNESETEYVKVENGCFELPTGFDGNIVLPFGVFAKNNGDFLEENPNKIMGFGFVFVAEDMREYELNIYDFILSDSESMPDVVSKNILLLRGADNILKPKVGESESQYTAVLADMCGREEEATVELSLETEVEGISVKEDGWICVGEEAQPEKIVLIARSENGIIARKEVDLYTSWTNSTETENGWDASIASPEEISPIIGMEQMLTDDMTLWVIRLFICGVAIVFLMYYKGIRQKERGEK